MNNFTSIKQIILIIATAISVSVIGCSTTVAKADNVVKNTNEPPLERFWENHKCGFKRGGKIVIKAEYDFVDDFFGDLAIVSKNDKYGYINKQGKVIIPLQYDFRLGTFHDGLAYVKKDGKYGFIDKNGKIIIPLKYDDARRFNEGLAGVKNNGKYGFINKQDKVVIPFQYDSVYIFRKGLALVQKDGKIFTINKKGECVKFGCTTTTDKADNEVEDIDEYVKQFINEHYFAPFRKYNKFGFKRNDKVVIKAEYDYVHDFSEDLSVVGKNDKCGYINKQGKVIIPLQYDFGTGDFHDGVAYVKKDEKYGFIDKNGKVIIPLKYDGARRFHEGLAEVKNNGKWGFINTQDKVVIPFQYDFAFTFFNGLILVEKDGKTFYINKKGECVEDCE